MSGKTATLLLLSTVVQGLSQTIHFEAKSTSRTPATGRFGFEWRADENVVFESETELSRTATVAQAVVRIGNLETHGWTLEAGRQRLSYGDERLLGANHESRPSMPGWDCVRFQVNRGRLSSGFFAGASRAYGASLQGAFASVQAGPNLAIEPYLLRTGLVQAHGLRFYGQVRGIGYNIEVANEPHAWAGHWEVTRNSGLYSAGVEANYATPRFNELFPATLNKYGTEDPFGWRDTRNVAINVDRGRRNLTLATSYRSYWNARGAYLAQQAIVALTYKATHWQLQAGCGRLLANRAADAPAWTPLLALTYRL